MLSEKGRGGKQCEGTGLDFELKFCICLDFNVLFLFELKSLDEIEITGLFSLMGALFLF